MLSTATTSRSEIEQLGKLIAQHAVMKAAPGEEFVLASGRKSSLYLDAKLISMAPEAVVTMGRLVRDEAIARGATAVGGLAAGAIPLTMAAVACEATDGQARFRGFYIRAEGNKDHGTREALFQAFGYDGAKLVAEGTRALVVDDVLTTGKSIAEAANKVIERGAQIAAIVVLVDRNEGGAGRLRDEFDVPIVALYRVDSDGDLTFVGAEV